MTEATKGKIAGGVLLGLMALAWFTLQPGKIRLITLVILGLFLFRIVMRTARARYDEEKHEDDERD